MVYAALAEDSTGRPHVSLLDELDSALQRRTRTTQSILTAPNRMHVTAQDMPAGQHWSDSGGECSKLHCRHPSRSFLTFAISSSLTLYVKAKLGLEVRSVNANSCRPLLEYATTCQPFHQGFHTRGSRGYLKIHPPMVDFLLQSGLDPNENIGGYTPWRKVLNYLHCTGKDRLEVAWVDVCKLFLYYGANPAENINYLQAVDIIRKAFGHLASKDVADLEVMFKQSRLPILSGDRTPQQKLATTSEQHWSSAKESTSLISTHGGLHICFARHPATHINTTHSASHKVREGGRVRKRERWTAGDRVPYVLRGMTRKRSGEVHFGLRGRGAKIGHL